MPISGTTVVRAHLRRPWNALLSSGHTLQCFSSPLPWSICNLFLELAASAICHSHVVNNPALKLNRA
eukprot:6391419-Amphidinium_carterae.1